MKLVKIGGLFAGFVSKMNGLPFSDNLSMLLEELISSSSEMKEGMKRIEVVLEGQVIGLAEAAKIALENATSKYLTVDEKLAEVKDAKKLFEQCYGALLKIPTLNKHRGR